MKRSAAVVTRRRRQNTAFRYLVNCQLFQEAILRWGCGELCLFILSVLAVKT